MNAMVIYIFFNITTFLERLFLQDGVIVYHTSLMTLKRNWMLKSTHKVESIHTG